jgi:hypothetical protein
VLKNKAHKTRMSKEKKKRYREQRKVIKVHEYSGRKPRKW